MNRGSFLALWLALAVRGFACQTFAETLQERVDTAPSGATLLVEAGVHDGAIHIRKPLTLRADGSVLIRGSGDGHIIHVEADNVTIEGFSLQGSGFDLGQDHSAVFVTGNRAVIRDNRIGDSLHGIYLKRASHCRIEGNTISGALVRAQSGGSTGGVSSGGDFCEVNLDQNRRGNGIHLWNCEQNIIIGNQISLVRDGIYFSFANHSIVRANTISEARFGLHYMYSDGNVFEHNTFSRNSAGSTLMFSRNMMVRGNVFEANVGHRAYGMVLTSVDTSRFEKNVFNGNSVGLCLEYSNANIFDGNLVSRSTIGARLTASSDTNAFTRNTFIGNLHSVELDGDFRRNAWEQAGVGNRWGHSGEVDLDGNGVGDLPHREADLAGNLRRPFPLVALLSGSPALDLVRFAQRHAPIPGLRSITDPKPLTGAMPSNLQ